MPRLCALCPEVPPCFPRSACSVKCLILEQIAGQGVLVALSFALNAVP